MTRYYLLCSKKNVDYSHQITRLKVKVLTKASRVSGCTRGLDGYYWSCVQVLSSHWYVWKSARVIELRECLLNGIRFISFLYSVACNKIERYREDSICCTQESSDQSSLVIAGWFSAPVSIAAIPSLEWWGEHRVNRSLCLYLRLRLTHESREQERSNRERSLTKKEEDTTCYF